MNNIVDIQDLEKKIDDFNLGPIDFQAQAGTITALIGNNGSGKSTLLKLMMDLAKPDKGNIKLFQKFVYGHDESWKVDIAYLPQTQIGYDPYTGQMLKSLIQPLYPNWDDTLFTKLIKEFAVPLNKKYSKLSQGAQQKLNLALTIPRNANLLILDEPTNFIDIPAKKVLIDVLAEWMEDENRAIIIASHQIEDIRKLADYLVILRSGAQIGSFEKEELRSQYQSYWLTEEPHSLEFVNGIIELKGNLLISDNPSATERDLTELGIVWNNQQSLELEDILDILLKR